MLEHAQDLLLQDVRLANTVADQVMVIDTVSLARESLRNPNLALDFAKELGADVSWPKQYERAKI